MSTTTKRGLNKPDRADYVSVITAINNNMDNLDDAVPDSRKVNGKALSSDVTIDDTDLPIIAGKIASTQAMIAPPFVEATPNDEGTFVTNAGGLYYLPSGHTANETWANTTKTAVDIDAVIAALKESIADKQDPLTFDSTPTQNSTNPVTSGGVYSAIKAVEIEDSALPKIVDSDAEDVDIDITDNNGNVIVRFADGHIEVKEFDSRDVGDLDDLETTDKTSLVDAINEVNGAVDDKIDMPTGGTAGQVLGLDRNLDPAWIDQSGGGGSGNVDAMDSDAEDVDLDITDNSGNVIARFADGHIKTKYFDSANIGTNAHIITLKTSGGDFSTLKAALDSITDADPETNPYEIHVYPGTYDTLSGFTDEEIRAADIGGGYTDDSMVGCKLTDGISLIGIGDRRKIILNGYLNPSDYSLAIRGNISTLNLQGTCRIENLTIKARSLRYCIHDDFGSTKHYERIVRNCAFSAYGYTLSYYPATTYGAGIASPGMDALFEDVDFGFSWGYHSRTGMTGDSHLVFRHCTGLSARLGDQAAEADTAVHSFQFDGCDFATVAISRPTATTPHIFAYGVNNLRTMLFCKAADIPQFSSLLKTSPSNLPVGTVVNVNNGGMTTSSEGITAQKATSIDSAIGVIMFKDSDYDYIQRDGFIQGEILGLTGLSVGDYVTVDSDMILTGSGATSSNAFGVVKYTDTNDRSQIWIMGR